MIKKRSIRKLHSSSVNKFKVIFYSSILFFVASLVGRLYFTANITVKNSQLTEYYVRKSLLEQEATRLKYNDLALSSLTSVKSRAESMGFEIHQGLLLSLDLTTPPTIALR